MIIAVNTRLLLKDRMEGIGRFTFEILKRITNAHKEHTFIFFFDRKFDKSFLFSDNIIPVLLFPPARHPFLWYWYFEYSVAKSLKKYKADVFVTTDGWLSTKTNVKTLQVLHDLHYEDHPEFLPFFTRKYYQYFFPRFVKKANRIVTVSHFCKMEIIKKYSIDSNAIDVVYNSTRESYSPLSDLEKLKVKNKYTGGKSYFLFIGPIHPRKNLGNAIKAFMEYKNQTNDQIQLIITGAFMWKGFKQRNGVLPTGFANDIIYTGYLNNEELYQLTASAECLLYVSFYEGFGLPILEAMSCNVPVITSNISAMPEIAGESALLVNPNDYLSITEALLKIQSDKGVRLHQIQNGKKNLERFSWDRSSKLFWTSILKTAECDSESR
jgi:glycosyltransferase involved in cell wall biosynthesis